MHDVTLYLLHLYPSQAKHLLVSQAHDQSHETTEAMFKKRTRPASVRDKPEVKDDEPTTSETIETPIASGSNTPDVETGDENGCVPIP